MATSRRKGMGKGRGKGYKNLQTPDRIVHSRSAKGQKTFDDPMTKRMNLQEKQRETEWDLKQDSFGNMLQPQNPDAVIQSLGFKHRPAVFLRGPKFNFARYVKKDSKGLFFQYDNVKYYLPKSLVKQEFGHVPEEKSENTFARDKEGKISTTILSEYGKKQLKILDGAIMGFTDGTITVKGNKLIDEKGKVIETIDNDRLVNKIIFRVI